MKYAWTVLACKGITISKMLVSPRKTKMISLRRVWAIVCHLNNDTTQLCLQSRAKYLGTSVLNEALLTLSPQASCSSNAVGTISIPIWWSGLTAQTTTVSNLCLGFPLKTCFKSGLSSKLQEAYSVNSRSLRSNCLILRTSSYSDRQITKLRIGGWRRNEQAQSNFCSNRGETVSARFRRAPKIRPTKWTTTFRANSDKRNCSRFARGPTNSSTNQTIAWTRREHPIFRLSDC